MSLALSHSKIQLPYDIINTIFNYLSQITDSGWFLEVSNDGKVRIIPRPEFRFKIHNLNEFKLGVRARYVQLNIQTLTGLEDDASSCIVEALEQPHRAHSLEKIENDARQGVVAYCRCYTYIDPATSTSMVAYVEIRKYTANREVMFYNGILYNEKGETNLIDGFGDDGDGNTRIVVNPFTMIWDFDEDYDHWDAEEPIEEIDHEMIDPEVDQEIEEYMMQMYL